MFLPHFILFEVHSVLPNKTLYITDRLPLFTYFTIFMNV